MKIIRLVWERWQSLQKETTAQAKLEKSLSKKQKKRASHFHFPRMWLPCFHILPQKVGLLIELTTSLFFFQKKRNTFYDKSSFATLWPLKLSVNHFLFMPLPGIFILCHFLKINFFTICFHFFPNTYFNFYGGRSKTPCPAQLVCIMSVKSYDLLFMVTRQ